MNQRPELARFVIPQELETERLPLRMFRDDDMLKREIEFAGASFQPYRHPQKAERDRKGEAAA